MTVGRKAMWSSIPVFGIWEEEGDGRGGGDLLIGHIGSCALTGAKLQM